MEVTEIKYFVEAALLAAGRPMSVDQLHGLFDEAASPEKSDIRDALAALQTDYEPRGIEIIEVASGFRMQVRSAMAERLSRLWEERPPRYSRALFETLALIAYRQPMTRGEIEEIRGVAVSPNIMRSLLEREWVRVVGHRDVPGRPAMFGTTRQFLDYFGLKKLDDLPPLADLSDWESLRVQLNLPAVNEEDERDDGEDSEESHGAVVTRLPVAERRPPQDEDGEAAEAGSDDATEAMSDEDLEPIEATEWPDPSVDVDVEVNIVRSSDDDAPVTVDADADDDLDEVDVESGNTSARNA